MYLAGTAVLELLGEPRARSVTTAACCFASAREAVGERQKRSGRMAAQPGVVAERDASSASRGTPAPTRTPRVVARA